MYNEDWEHEAQKDYVYLQEQQMLIEQEYYRPEYGIILTDLNQNVCQQKKLNN